jgi:uncharacterized peroxidase-related enzyme
VVEAVLDDWEKAPIPGRTRAMLGFLEKLTLRPAELGGADAAALRRAGISEAAAADAIHVAALFNMIDRIADGLKFHVQDRRGFEEGAKILLGRGYVL